MMNKVLHLTLAAALLLAGSQTAGAAPGAVAVDPQADRVLREMGEYLSSAREFSFHAEAAYDGVEGGQKILFGGAGDIAVRRPDRLNAEFDGDERQTRVVFDGKTITVYNLARKVYAAVEAHSEIDAALDRLFEVYGSSVPLADLVYSNPYETLIKNVQSGFLVGQHRVDGTRCHHLAFSQEGIDWQIWIEIGPRPVPRKLVITYKDEPDSPQYIAELSGWNFQPRLSEHYFTFRPPEGSDEIEFLPRQDVPGELSKEGRR